MLPINAKVLHFLLSRHTTPLSSLVRISGRMGSHRLLETFGLAAFALSCSAQCRPRPGVCLWSVGSGRSMGDTGANICCSREPGSRPPDFLIPSRPSVEGSSAVIEAPYPPLSNGKFPQATDKTKVFQENGLGVYWGSFTFMFRRIFACAGTSVSVRLFGS